MAPRSNRVNCIIAVVLAAGISVAASGCAVKSTAGKPKTEPVREAPVETWYVVKMSGSPVGFASDSKHTLPDGNFYRTHMDLTLSRMGTRMSMFVAAEEFDDVAGRPRSFDITIKASSMGIKISGVLEADTISLRTESPGFSDERRIAWEPGAMGQAAGEKYVLEQLRAGKTEFSYRTFDPQAAEFKTVTIKKIETEPEEIDGEMQQPIAFEEYEDDSNIPRATTWFDQEYQPVRTVFLQLGVEIVLERITPEQMELIELEPNFDIIKQSMIPCEGYPGDPVGVADVTMRLHFRHPLAADRDFPGPNQKVLSRGEDWIEILVSRETVTRSSLSQDKLDAFLAPDRFIQSEHPSIQAVADSIRKETGKTGWVLARELGYWVNHHITSKNLEKGFATALEVLESGAGDCTEHAVLLTALLRAADIPARPAVGVAYANGTFIGHMWTEAYVGHWRSLDALDLGNDPIRIRISTSDDGGAINEKDLVHAYAVVGGMQAQVTDYHLHAAE